MAFTEFCCRSGGSNLNAGTRLGNSTEPGTSAALTYASGSWVSSTGVFTVASGDPVADGVAVGDFASVYADGASVTTLVGRVTARTTTTITVSTTAKSGTTTDGTSNRTLKIGGAWAGPSGSTAFPFGFVTQALQNSATNNPRVNFKNDATYSITAAMTHANNDCTFHGYSTSYGDTGRATIDGGSSGASYVLLTVSGTGTTICNFVFNQNGATGSENGVTWSGATGFMRNCVFSNMRGNGLSISSSGVFSLLEAFGCNASNTSNFAGIQVGNVSPLTLENCISHDNVGSNSNGFYIGGGGGGQSVINCIADTNGANGFVFTSNGNFHYARNCSAYNNTSNGFFFQSNTNRTVLVAVNCLAVSNGAYGFRVDQNGSLNYSGHMLNCGHFSNTSGGVGLAIGGSTDDMNVNVSGTIALAANPFVDAPNGDFRLNTAESKNVGWESFTQTASSYAGTVGYPDLGAAQSQVSGVRSVNIRGGADQ